MTLDDASPERTDKTTVFSTTTERTGVEDLEPSIGATVAIDALASADMTALDSSRFVREEQIAVGAMGAVFKARDLESGRVVALKVVHPIYASDPALTARLFREAVLAQRVHSPYAVTVLGFGVDQEGQAFLAMDYVAGGNLRDELAAHGPFTTARARGILLQVSEALAAAHRAGVLHRDVKASNILLTPDGLAMLTDFGIARGIDLASLTSTTEVLGTPTYLAPEGPVDGRSDLYSLGCVFYELLAGVPPFEGPTHQAVMLAHVRDKPNLSRLPSTERRLAGWLLAKPPELRPANADALLAVLRGEARLPPGAGGDTRSRWPPGRGSGTPPARRPPTGLPPWGEADHGGPVGGSSIYLRTEAGLVRLAETPYEAEAALQALLAEFPELLAGEQIHPRSPRRWLLVEREAGIAGEIGGATRWSLDHLFVDQEGIPTLVEVKRSSDTRLRRGVVAQMLDYAANVLAHWSPEEIRRRFYSHYPTDRSAAERRLMTFLESSNRVQQMDAPSASTMAEFWESVSRNLKLRRIRLLFVADSIPTELQRIVEYLNEAMMRTEVYAIELKQYKGSGHHVFVPRLIGLTPTAVGVKQGTRTRSAVDWDDSTFLSRIEEVAGPKAAGVAQRLADWTRENGLVSSLSRGKTGPRWARYRMSDGQTVNLFGVYVHGRVEVAFYSLARHHPFTGVEARRELGNRLNAIPGVSISPDMIERATTPGLAAVVIDDLAAFDAFVDAFAWVVTQLSGGSPN